MFTKYKQIFSTVLAALFLLVSVAPVAFADEQGLSPWASEAIEEIRVSELADVRIFNNYQNDITRARILYDGGQYCTKNLRKSRNRP